MKKVWITCALVGVLAMAVSTACWAKDPEMRDRKDSDVWRPHRIYENFVGVTMGTDEDPEWEIGIWTKRKGKLPKTFTKRENWENGAANLFMLQFDQETGLATFTVGTGGSARTVTHTFAEYAGRGMEDLHIAANSSSDEECWAYTFMTDLKIDGEDCNFVDIDGYGIFYASVTIGGLECEDFVLTGYVWNNWIGRPEKNKRVQMNIRFGEPCGPAHDIQYALESDMDGDCIVNLKDFEVLAANWLANCGEPQWCGGGDINTDNIVNTDDLMVAMGEWLTKYYGGGCGTESVPFLIYTAKQLNAIGINPWDWDAHFRMMADIELNEYTGNAFNTIGTPEEPFTGVFDGNNFSIINFTQGDANNPVLGLFRCVDGPDAVIKNLRLVNPNVATKMPSYAGALVGKLNNGLILRCFVDGGEVAGYGGLALTVGANYVGGLAGFNAGDIVESASTATVCGYDIAGGLAGYNEGTIQQCFSEGETIAGHDKVGGLVGWNSRGIISNCYSKKSIFAHDEVGGLVGHTYDGMIEKCYSMGHVTENSDFRGGLVGDVGGIGAVEDSFWDIDTGGYLNDNNIGIPRLTSEMQTETTFTSAGWDFAATPIWTMDGTEYPWLLWSDCRAPEPNAATWDTPPMATGPNSILMVATTATDVSGVEYYFNNITNPNHDSGWQDGSSYEDTNLEELTLYIYQVKIRDKSTQQNETAWSVPQAATTEDGTTPLPNPMQWSIEPAADGPYAITMMASPASDESGVELYFSNVTDPSHDSGWQSSPFYVDTGLDPNTEYTYKVIARDKSANQNETGYSPEASATTDPPDTTVPQPDPMDWASDPNATSLYSIIMTAATASDENGVQYYFNNITDPCHDSGWQNSPVYEDTALDPNVEYTYQVKARDKSPQYNETGYSSPASATTTDVNPPLPNPMAWASAPALSGPYSAVMTAATATDDDAVEYYFHNATDPSRDSGWQDGTTFADPNLDPAILYTYKVKARDKSPQQNTTAYSSPASVLTESGTPRVEVTETFYSQSSPDGRIWDNGEWEPHIRSYDNLDATEQALRLGDYGMYGYKCVLSFDTSVLPEDSTVLSATLEMTRTDEASGLDPFEWGGNCLVDIVSGHFGPSVALENEDWDAAAGAAGVAEFVGGDPGINTPMSTEISAGALSHISIADTTQFRVYFTTPTSDPNDNVFTDYLSFYSGEYTNIAYRPKLTITYDTRSPVVTFPSIPAQDGRTWNKDGGAVGDGFDAVDNDDRALRLGDYEEFTGQYGYRNVLSFDTSPLPADCQIISAQLVLTRGHFGPEHQTLPKPAQDPFTWAGDCLIDIANPHFGSEALEASDWEATGTAAAVAQFLADPGDEQPMPSTEFNQQGRDNINKDGITQLKVYFTTELLDNGDSDFLGFYSGEYAAVENLKAPQLVIRYQVF